jgi:RNA polymerase sigma factor (TIGR02999 family)
VTPSDRAARDRPPDDASAAGSPGLIDGYYQHAYDELRRIAAAVRRGDPFASISTRTIVHEAWLKLSSSVTLHAEDERHLRNVVVRAMRQVMVDSARYRRAAKRAGVEVPIDAELPLPVDPEERVLAIDDALGRLESLDPALGQVVQARFFGGFTFAEIAEHRGVSESTVWRQWNAARALLAVWLKHVD